MGAHVPLLALAVGVVLCGAALAASRVRADIRALGADDGVASRSARAEFLPPPATPRPQQAATPTSWQAARLEELMRQLDVAWNAQNWAQALQIIEQIIQIDPNYDHIQDRKYQAHVNYGYSLLTAGDCSASLYQFQMAQAMRPNGEEVRMGLDLLNRYCATPAPPTATFTPAPTPGPTHTPGTPTPTPTGLAEPIQYTVQRGDTLFSLAKRYSTSVQAIMQANGMMSHLIRVGQVIWIPASQPPPGPIVHIVQPGETLYSIARLYNTTVWAISVANQLQGYSIYAYQALYVPSAQQPGAMIHIVQPGETLFTIARIHKTTVPLLMLANGLQNYHLVVYQRVLIPPAGWTGWPPLWPGGYPPGGMPVPQVHVVKAGETLFSIAQRYGVTVAALRAANGLKGSTIYVGQTLRLP